MGGDAAHAYMGPPGGTNVGSVTWTHHYAQPDYRPYAWGTDIDIGELVKRLVALEERLTRLEKSHE